MKTLPSFQSYISQRFHHIKVTCRNHITSHLVDINPQKGSVQGVTGSINIHNIKRLRKSYPNTHLLLLYFDFSDQAVKLTWQPCNSTSFTFLMIRAILGKFGTKPLEVEHKSRTYAFNFLQTHNIHISVRLKHPLIQRHCNCKGSVNPLQFREKPFKRQTLLWGHC